jgi:uncharacterized protein (TIGR02231 family)
MDLSAPIVAVTVHPDRARITRRGTVTLPAGASEVVLADLPDGLADDSVRVSGRGAARVVGVDVARRDLADAPDERVRAAEDAVRAAERELAAIEGADAADTAREDMLRRLATRSGDRLATALAEGTATPDRVTEIGTAVAAQLVDVAAARRGHAERREAAGHALAAARAELERLTTSGRRRREVRIALEADAGTEPDAGTDVELEVTYLVPGASWSAAYDARVEQDRLSLTCFGLVTQTTGEDWPACEVTLSSTRPAVAGAVPELDPWWVDVRPPMPVLAAAAAPGGAPMRARMVAPDMAFESAVAVPVEGTLAVAWRLPRPVAVAGNGTAHRTVVRTAELQARLDHVTAPALGTDVHLRATAVNTSGAALLPGPLSTYLDGGFAGSTRIDATAPGEEIELALGLDDRVSVERELVGRTAGKTLMGGKRESVETWTVTVHNGRPAPVHLVVRERIPVSRHADVQVVDVALTPDPAERDDLGRVEWRADVAAGADFTARLRFGVRHARDLPVTGWT